MYCLSAQLIPKWWALKREKKWLLRIFKNLRNANVSPAEVIISPRNKIAIEILWPLTHVLVHNLTSVWLCIYHFAVQYRKYNKVDLLEGNNTIHKIYNYEKLTIQETGQSNKYLSATWMAQIMRPFNTEERSLWWSEIIIAFTLFPMWHYSK